MQPTIRHLGRNPGISDATVRATEHCMRIISAETRKLLKEYGTAPVLNAIASIHMNVLARGVDLDRAREHLDEMKRSVEQVVALDQGGSRA